jgi:Cu-Zn family superoxide dismutase
MNRLVAKAFVKVGLLYPKIEGLIIFEQYQNGVEVTVKINNLPKFSRENGVFIGPFGFHLHNGNSCNEGTVNEPFPLAGEHYNPSNQPHGNHAGDFPVLMPMSNGTASMKFATDKFTVADILGKVVVVHLSPDDYRSEPAGNSGLKIACGVIKRAG